MQRLKHILRVNLLIRAQIVVIMAKVIPVVTMRKDTAAESIPAVADVIQSLNLMERILARPVALTTGEHLMMERSLTHHMIEASRLNLFAEPV